MADGAATVEKLEEIYRQMNALHQQGGFELAKWNSNSIEFITAIKAEPASKVVEFGDTGILGMTCQLAEDQISLKISPDAMKPLTSPTKAEVVSAISKVYDPTGLFAPVILTGKLIMQDFWRNEKIGWKTKAPDQQEIPLLTKVKIPRWLGCMRSEEL